MLNLGQTNTIFADSISVACSINNLGHQDLNLRFHQTRASNALFLSCTVSSSTAVKKWSIGEGLAQSGTTARAVSGTQYTYQWQW